MAISVIALCKFGEFTLNRKAVGAYCYDLAPTAFFMVLLWSFYKVIHLMGGH